MEETRSHLPVEDMVMKTAAQYFSDELFPYLGIHEKVTVAAPTEQVYLEAKSFYEDFNYEVTKEAWIHLEFESDSIREDDLKRFRCYEAMTSYTYHVSVTTYVICSSKVKQILSQLNSGINTYCIIPIRLQDKNADQLFAEVLAKQEKGVPLEKKDLVPLLLSSLMSGDMKQIDRILHSSRLIQESGVLDQEEITRMQSVLYALANKFLDDEDLLKVREVLFMTRLGQMLYNDGVADGMAKGLAKGWENGWANGLAVLKRTNQLTARLLHDNRHDDLARSLEDADYQDQLFKEYNL